MPIKNKDIKHIQAFVSTFQHKYKNEMNQVVELFKERKIETMREAMKTIELLGSKGKKKNIQGLERIEKQKEKETATGKLVRFNMKRGTTQKYHISGTIHTRQTYSRTRSGTTKYYDKVYNVSTQDALVITAISKVEAIKLFKKEMVQKYSRSVKPSNNEKAEEEVDDNGGYYLNFTDDRGGTDYVCDDEVTGVDIDSVFLDKNTKSHSESNMMMKSVHPVKYQFIPSDDKHLNNTGECVVDQIDKIYGHLNKKLSRNNFIKQCYELENGMNKNSLDQDTEDSWKLEDGVRTSTLNAILKTNNVSYYSFDILNKCFDKNISHSRNYPCLVYYAVNNHMYWVGDKDKALSLTREARDMESKINSEMIQQYEEASNIYLNEDGSIKPIFENIPISKLMDEQYNNSIIFYNQTTHIKGLDYDEYESRNDLSNELHSIIQTYNYIPHKFKHDKYKITRIIFEHGERNIILNIDGSNDTIKETCYKDIIKLCNTNGIEFKNQSFGAIVQELRKRHYDKDSNRIKFSKTQRETIYNKFNKICNICKKEMTLKQCQIDHISPLACGGTNDDINLQSICKECHFEKTQEEKENHEYIKISDTNSSYNTQLLDIINSSSNLSRSFVETFVKYSKKNDLIFKIDMNKSRKNAMYYSQFNYPLFTVMDNVKPFIKNMNYKKPGLYFIESEIYFPIRGNGWYSHAMIKYLIDNKLITTDNIQYVVYSSLNVDKHYFNSFIDEAYSIKDGYEKLKVNCMIGSLKPATRDNFKTLAIGTDLNTIYYHYLGTKASFIENFDIDNVRYYHVYEKYESKCEETETPIYNMVIELEIINLYELYKEINNKGGTILDVNTDCCVCTFKDNKIPFELDDTGNIKGYYHDKEEQVYKYRLEEKSDRLKCQMLPKWQRTQKYEYKQAEWNITNDCIDNDFKPLVKQILDSKKSINIDGRAGVGKSFFIKNLHQEMDERKLKYVSLAPTNKACRVIDGITICKFIASFKMKSFIDGKYDYIFIDEISMVQEIYYKFFIYLKRANPKIKFIIAGDFEQLMPVKDRVTKM